MKSITIPFAGAALAVLLAVGAAGAASPTTAGPTPAATPAPATTPVTAGTVAAILGLTDAEVMTLRHEGLSLAQIAERQGVDPQRLVDALAAQWTSRIDARVAAGALTADEATQLKANVALQAKAMVEQAAMGGMRGAAVGAGPDGTMGGMRAGMGPGRMGAGRGGMMRGGGTGVCPVASPSPAS